MVFLNVVEALEERLIRLQHLPDFLVERHLLKHRLGLRIEPRVFGRVRGVGVACRESQSQQEEKRASYAHVLEAVYNVGGAVAMNGRGSNNNEAAGKPGGLGAGISQ
jgi:hypothetical protein